jgi:nitrate/nitrite transporter NarK
MVQSLAKDIPGTVVKDMRGTSIRSVPMMKNVRDMRDVSLIYRVCYDWEGIPWIGFVQSVYGTPFAVGVASISSSSAYPYLDSGQMCGVLAGAAGAAGYERLLKCQGSGTRIVARQSFATLYVVLAVVLGNLAMLAMRIEKKRRTRTQ